MYLIAVVGVHSEATFHLLPSSYNKETSLVNIIMTTSSHNLHGRYIIMS